LVYKFERGQKFHFFLALGSDKKNSQDEDPVMSCVLLILIFLSCFDSVIVVKTKMVCSLTQAIYINLTTIVLLAGLFI